jgi:hypothetical protein
MNTAPKLVWLGTSGTGPDFFIRPNKDVRAGQIRVRPQAPDLPESPHHLRSTRGEVAEHGLLTVFGDGSQGRGFCYIWWKALPLGALRLAFPIEI